MKKYLLNIVLGCSCMVVTVQAQAELSYQEISKAYQSSYLYEKTENYDDAIKAAMLVYNHYQDAYTINLRLGHLFLQQGSYANASRHYHKAQQALPNSVSPKLGLMSVAIAQAQYEKVETIGFDILKRDNYNYYGNLKLAYALQENKKYANAAAVVEKMLAFYPEDVAFLSQYAALFAAQQQYTQASDYYARVLILDPENTRANYYFSVLK